MPAVFFSLAVLGRNIPTVGGGIVQYAQHVSTRQTPQSELILGTQQVVNDAGGYAWAVDDWTRLDRFLVLGSEGGTYYTGERALTRANAEAVARCIAQDGLRTVVRIAELSESGRCPKNDPALFALAMAASLGDASTKHAALAALPRVARIGTHLFTFAENVQAFRGWGRGLRRAIGAWYTEKRPRELALQMAKYRQRNGWSHRDLLRLAHPVAPSPAHAALFDWVAHGTTPSTELPELIGAFTRVQAAEDRSAVVKEITASPFLTWEMIPSQHLGHADVWAALLPNIPLGALIRNLGRMTANGLLTPMSDAARTVAAKLTDKLAISEARVHPVSVLAALATYEQGHGERGKLSWDPSAQVVDALNAAFYAAFGNVEPSAKRMCLCLDLSNSMCSSTIAGIPGLTPRKAAAAMALVTAAREPNHVVLGFTAHGGDAVQFPGVSSEDLPLACASLPISASQRLPDVLRSIEQHALHHEFGGTDCSLPMRWALERKVPVDLFVVYTDSQTWAGDIHPIQALQQYRERMGIPAKLVVVGMTSGRFSIADPDDAGMLDVVGFDTATPQLIADFAQHT